MEANPHKSEQQIEQIVSIPTPSLAFNCFSCLVSFCLNWEGKNLPHAASRGLW